MVSSLPALPQSDLDLAWGCDIYSSRVPHGHKPPKRGEKGREMASPYLMEIIITDLYSRSLHGEKGRGREKEEKVPDARGFFASFPMLRARVDQRFG